MSLTVEWFGTTARFGVPDVEGLPLPVRPRLRVVDSMDSSGDLDFGFERSESGWRLTLDSEPMGPEGTLETLWERAWDHLELQVAARSVDPVFIHAGAVAAEGVGIVLPGRSGRGKTSLVLALCRAGATYYSDEYALIDTEARLHPYARDPHVRAGAGGRGTPTPISAFTDRVGTDPVPIAGVLVARHEPGAHWEPRELEARSCVLALLDNAVGARTRTPAVMDAIGAVARSAWCADGVRGEPDEVSKWVRMHLAKFAK